MRLAIVIGAAALVLAGCQTAEQSMVNAESVCMETGLKPGSRQYQRCVNAGYRNNVAQSNAAANQAAAGAAVGVIGGAVLGAATARPSYYCGWGGCW
jgi:carbonic anhydrase/acetyltransferase-like protein (isoleucine patch superfamily)